MVLSRLCRPQSMKIYWPQIINIIAIHINKIETIETSDRTVPAHTKTKCNDCNSSAMPSSFKEILYTNTSYSRENNNGLIATTAYHPYRALNLHECIASVMTMTA